MTITVCFDALGTCFSLDPAIKALDDLLGKDLRAAGGDARMTIMDWFHSAQRDYTYRSITSAPPPPISQILKLSLPRSLTVALNRTPSSSPSNPLPDLTAVTSQLAHLTPQPGLEECWTILKKEMNANVLVITNGAKKTTEGYIQQAGLEELVDVVRSCDEVGFAKPFVQVYESALQSCTEVEEKNDQKGERWFVAAHLWDLAAARKAGFKTGYVLAEQPPLGEGQEQEWYDLFGGQPDVIGKDLAEVAQKIRERVSVCINHLRA